jgi:uncharacterized protein (DUF2141 family)
MVWSLVGAAILIASGADADPPESGRITAQVTGLRNTRGTLRCLLFASQAGFPTEYKRALKRAETPIRSSAEQCVFESLSPGTYAITYIHDENDNGKLDTNVLGMPTEGYGTSRDARGGVGGPPKFDAAKFEFKGGAATITMKTAY